MDVIRAASSLEDARSQCDLKFPDRVHATNLRKHCATIAQVRKCYDTVDTTLIPVWLIYLTCSLFRTSTFSVTAKQWWQIRITSCCLASLSHFLLFTTTPKPVHRFPWNFHRMPLCTSCFIFLSEMLAVLMLETTKYRSSFINLTYLELWKFEK